MSDRSITNIVNRSSSIVSKNIFNEKRIQQCVTFNRIVVLSVGRIMSYNSLQKLPNMEIYQLIRYCVRQKNKIIKNKNYET